jgi:DNA primase
MRDGRQAFFLFLPEGEDPDTLVRKEGREGFETRLQNAKSLSEYFYEYMLRDMKVATLGNRARLAEYAKPYLAKLPDGSFRDSMYEDLTKRTWVKLSPEPTISSQQTAPATAKEMPRRTLVRSAIAMLLADPSLAQEITLPHAFAGLDKPGIALLTELLDFLQERPGINTAMLLEHFAGRDESAALQKLALTEFPGEPEALRAEFVDAVRKLGEQTTQQRLDALIRKQSEVGLDDAEKSELRALLSRKAKPGSG